MVDIRESKAKDLSFGNMTVIPLMQEWGARQAFVYGEHSQVLATALGLADSENQYANFGYPIKVLLPYLTNFGNVPNWNHLLTSWYGVKQAQSVSELIHDDMLVILDITQHSHIKLINHAVQLINVAKKRQTPILVVTKPGERLPTEIAAFAGSFVGSQNSYWKIFTYHTIANFIYNCLPSRIFIFGDGLRVVSSAIGAVDILSRFDSKDESLVLTATRVKVDVETPLAALGSNLTPEMVFTSFELEVSDTHPADAVIEYSDRQVLITPV